MCGERVWSVKGERGGELWGERVWGVRSEGV